MKNSGNVKIIKNFFLTVFMLLACAALIIGTRLAGDKIQLRMFGKGYETVTFESVKNSCINFFNVVI